jgi:ankyrin repeat protein/Ca2+-binding EF-hand superfamily protein
MPSKYAVPAPPPSQNNKKKKTSETASELSLNDQLIEAVRESQIDEVEKLLILGANINYRSKNGWCAIHWVARTGNLPLIEYLYKQGADTNKPDRPDAWQPLHIAIKFSHFHIVRFLVETCEANIRARTRNRMTPLHWAAAVGGDVGLGIAQYLCERANIDLETAMAEAEANLRKFTEKKKQLLRDTTEIKIDAIDNRGYTPLMEAVANGHLGFVQWLKTEKKANLLKKNDVGMDCMAIAIAREHLHIENYLKEEVQALKIKAEKARKARARKKERAKKRRRAARRAQKLVELAAEQGMSVEEFQEMEMKKKTGTMEATDVFHIMGFSEKELDRFDEIFCSIDVDKSNFISPAELLKYFTIEDSEFGNRVFQMMDDSGDQQIDFKEFVCMMFLFCSVSKQHFNEFAFSLYDRDGSRSLEKDEIDEMISACYGAHWKQRPKVVKMVDSLSENNEITLSDWEDILKKHPFLLCKFLYIISTNFCKLTNNLYIIHLYIIYMYVTCRRAIMYTNL